MLVSFMILHLFFGDSNHFDMCYFLITLGFYLYLIFFQQALIDEDRLLSRLEVMGNQLQACSKVGINLK